MKIKFTPTGNVGLYDSFFHYSLLKLALWQAWYNLQVEWRLPFENPLPSCPKSWVVISQISHLEINFFWFWRLVCYKNSPLKCKCPCEWKHLKPVMNSPGIRVALRYDQDLILYERLPSCSPVVASQIYHGTSILVHRMKCYF